MYLKRTKRIRQKFRGKRGQREGKELRKVVPLIHPRVMRNKRDKTPKYVTDHQKGGKKKQPNRKGKSFKKNLR